MNVLAQAARLSSALANGLGAFLLAPIGRARLAFGHGRERVDGRAVARRFQVHLRPGGDQARAEPPRLPAGPQVVQGEHLGFTQGEGRILGGAAVRPGDRADVGHGHSRDAATWPASCALVSGTAAPASERIPSSPSSSTATSRRPGQR